VYGGGSKQKMGVVRASKQPSERANQQAGKQASRPDKQSGKQASKESKASQVIRQVLFVHCTVLTVNMSGIFSDL